MAYESLLALAKSPGFVVLAGQRIGTGATALPTTLCVHDRTVFRIVWL